MSTRNAISDECDRRTFLKYVGSGAALIPGMGLLATACGGDDEEGRPGAAPSKAELSGTIDHYTWEGYDLPRIIDPWLKANDLAQNASYIGIQQDVETKLLSPGGRGIDLSSANQGFVEHYLDLGILTEVTVEEVPTLAKLFPRFQEFPYKNENGTFNGVPWTWGFLGLTYSPERVEAEPESWEILLEPAYKDRVAVLDDAQNNIALAAVILGLNPDRLTQEEMAEVKEFLTQIVTQSKTLAASYGDFTSLMAAGEVDLIFLGWIGIDFFIEGAEAKTIVPNRGPNGLPGQSLAFSDLLIIPPDADNRTAALAFGEQVIKGKTAADAASFLGAGVTNPEVVPLLDEKTRNLFPYDDLDSFFERVVLNLGFPRGESEFVTFEQTLKEWDDIKSAAL